MDAASVWRVALRTGLQVICQRRESQMRKVKFFPESEIHQLSCSGNSLARGGSYATAAAALVASRPAASFAPVRFSNSMAQSARARSGQAT